MRKELKALENEQEQSKHDLMHGKRKLINQLRKNREMIEDNKGNFKFKKRLFIVRWYEKFINNARMAYYRLILRLFNNKK